MPGKPHIDLLRVAQTLMFEWILLLLFAAAVLTNVAERLAVPYPFLLAIAGVGLAFLPFAPEIRIDPELALALFVAPALRASRQIQARRFSHWNCLSSTAFSRRRIRDHSAAIVRLAHRSCSNV
jgi:hypothetical protein